VDTCHSLTQAAAKYLPFIWNVIIRRKRQLNCGHLGIRSRGCLNREWDTDLLTINRAALNRTVTPLVCTELLLIADDLIKVSTNCSIFYLNRYSICVINIHECMPWPERGLHIRTLCCDWLGRYVQLLFTCKWSSAFVLSP